MLRRICLNINVVATTIHLTAVTVYKTIGWIRWCGIVQPPKTFPVPQRRITVSPMVPVGISVMTAIAMWLVVIACVSTSIVVVLLFLPTSIAIRWGLSMATGRMLTIVPHIVGVIHISWLRPISKWMCLSFIISIIVNWFEGFQLIVIIGRKWLLISKCHWDSDFLLPILYLHI